MHTYKGNNYRTTSVRERGCMGVRECVWMGRQMRLGFHRYVSVRVLMGRLICVCVCACVARLARECGCVTGGELRNED